MAFNKDFTLVLLNTSDGKFIFKPFGYHKLLLAVFGAVWDGLEGALVGFIIGCFFDGKFIPKKIENKTIDNRLNYLMLGAFVVQQTGGQHRLSDTTISNRLITQFGDSYIENRMNFFKELLQQRIQVESICSHIKTEAKHQEKVDLIKFLLQLSFYPQIDKQKLHYCVNYVATHINIDPSIVNDLENQYVFNHTTSSSSSSKQTFTQNSYIKTPSLYSVFNLNSNCTEKELKKAYHQLAKKYHPDSNPHSSLRDQKLMQEKLRDIIEKYEKIKLEKGWK